MRLDVDFISRRQRELGLSRREISRALNVTITRLTNLYDGTYHGLLTLQQLGRLADLLACPPDRLLLSDDQQAAPTNQSLVATVTALLVSAKNPVSPSTLAVATGEELASIEATLEAIDAQLGALGLGVRRNTNDGAITIVATADVTAEQLETVLRSAQSRLELNVSAASLLYRIMTDEVTPRSIESSNDKRVRYGSLVNAGYVIEGARRTVPARLSDDVRESLLLDLR